MFFHASQTANLSVLTPHISNHEKSLVYLSSKRENVLVYLSNAVEKHCKEVGFKHPGVYKKWGSYGFSKDGILELEEYYPNATIDTYQGVSGYIYSTNKLEVYNQFADIPYVVTTEQSVLVEGCEFIPNAYEAILEAFRQGKIILKRYEEHSEQKLNWIKQSILREYEQSQNHPEYQLFLKAKFNFL